jgi:GDPmannose 4,6-dehydratase
LGYQVFVTHRRQPEVDPMMKSLSDKGVTFFFADMRDRASLESAFWQAWPDEAYNLAAQPFVPQSWPSPEITYDVNTGGFARLMEIVARVKPNTRVYQASTSEMYGNHSGACSEDTPFHPSSPYGCSKVAAHTACRMYRDLGLYVVGGILFNHASARRAQNMVEQKIARAVAAWSLGMEEVLELGNLESKRDWGFSKDFVKGMVLMLNQDIETHAPRDYVIGTGVSHSVRELLKACCKAAGFNNPPENLLKINETLVRKNDIRNLFANPSLAQAELGWRPETSFEQLCEIMVNAQKEKIQAMGSSKRTPYISAVLAAGEMY